MRSVYGKGTGSVEATIASADSGGFIAVASTDELDRDGERLSAGAFNPLPASIPVHMGHTMRPEDIVARARPFYVGSELHMDARFGSSPEAQKARTAVAEALIDSVSVVFTGLEWREVDGVRTLVHGELLACDLVSVGANAGARVLSVRAFGGSARAQVQRLRTDALLALAEVQLAEAKALLAKLPTRPGPNRRRVDAHLRSLAYGYPPATVHPRRGSDDC